MTQAPKFNLEAVARIIDPEAYDEISADDNEDGREIFADAWEDATAKSAASQRAFHRGVRACITWLHAEALKMNDPHAQQVLNNAAFSLGVDKPNPQSSPHD